jgi:ParB-like chromosome segregation protein Spo0J
LLTQLDQNRIALVSMPVARLRPYPKNARTHSKKQLRQIADSIQKFGFTNPVLISDDDEIIAGHGRVEAAKLLGMQSVPTLRLSHLDAAQRRAYFIADNKLALNAGWDRELLATELQALIDLEFDVEITGFSSAEIDLVLDEAREASVHAQETPEDAKPRPIDPGTAVRI